MGNESAEELIKKFLTGTATPEEEALLDSWYIAATRSQPEMAGYTNYREVEVEILILLETEQKKLLEAANKRNVTPVIRFWARIAAAIAVLIILSTGRLFIFHKEPTKRIVQR